MADVLMIDAAFPPPPDQLVADMVQIGATAAAVYIPGDPYANWTADHVGALRQRGWGVVPIVVPGDAGGDPQEWLAAVAGLGFAHGPVVCDFERGSSPPNSWWQAFVAAAHAARYQAIRYINQANSGAYDAGDGTWMAYYVQLGQVQPVPARPADCVAWQYTNEVSINGHAYDVSVVDAAFCAGPPAPQSTTTGGTGMLFVFNGTLHRVYVAGDNTIRHRFSPPGFADASQAILEVQPGCEEVIPGPPGISMDPSSLSMVALGAGWNIEVRDAHTGDGWLRVESDTSGQPMRDWTRIDDQPAAVPGAAVPGATVPGATVSRVW